MKHILSCPYCKKRVPIKFLTDHKNNCKLCGNKEIELFFQKWSGIVDEVQVTGVHDWSGTIKNIRITDEQSKDRFPCTLLWYMMAINSNGKVSTCNVDWDYSGPDYSLFVKKIYISRGK